MLATARPSCFLFFLGGGVDPELARAITGNLYLIISVVGVWRFAVPTTCTTKCCSAWTWPPPPRVSSTRHVYWPASPSRTSTMSSTKSRELSWNRPVAARSTSSRRQRTSACRRPATVQRSWTVAPISAWTYSVVDSTGSTPSTAHPSSTGAPHHSQRSWSRRTITNKHGRRQDCGCWLQQNYVTRPGLLAAMFVGEDLLANRRLQTLTLLWLDVEKFKE